MPFKILFLGQSEHHSLFDEILADRTQSAFWPASSASDAITIIRREAPHMVVIDFDMPGLQPLECFRTFAEESRGAKFIGITTGSPFSLVVNAVKAGFHEVINIHEEPAKLQAEVASLRQRWEEAQKGGQFHQQQKEKHDFGEILAASPEMKQVLEVVSKIIARKWGTVLIRGETGTGKELIARTIHYNGTTQVQPFVEVNCGAIPENLLEAEIFGYEKGAFTDAKARKKGLFELAEHGSFFLDEIGEINPLVQVKLLKAIEEKKIRRLGGMEDIHVNTRIIAATNRDLQAAIREGRFRQDLYYRLNVFTIELPPLRDRRQDVLLLARHYLAHYAKEYETPLTAFTPEAEALLKSYHWPGNVRELKHTIERLSLIAAGPLISRADLAEAIESDTPIIMAKKDGLMTVKLEIPTQGMSFDEAEKILIQSVLEEMSWNKRRTCRMLKISRPRLDRKIEKYGLMPPASQPE